MWWIPCAPPWGRDVYKRQVIGRALELHLDEVAQQALLAASQQLGDGIGRDCGNKYHSNAGEHSGKRQADVYKRQIFEYYEKPYEVFDYNTLKDDPLIDPTTIEMCIRDRARCVAEIAEWAEAKGVDLEGILDIKHAYNKTRPYRHGGKAL